jgi:hypothetical protein
MEGLLPDTAVRYLEEHLESHYRGPRLSQLLAGNHGEGGKGTFRIPLSDSGLKEDRIFFIGDVPVLFPCSGEQQWYSFREQSVVFHHDILKSAFYLLSGYQEHRAFHPDEYGRFPWKESIQYRLGFTEKPVVNDYFGIILDALEQYSGANGIPFERVRREHPFLFLSHDVDNIRKYGARNLAYAGLHFLGYNRSGRNLRTRWRSLADIAGGTLLFRSDPYWNFEEMLELEQSAGITSTWYFLENSGKENSRYRFSDPRIRDLIGTLVSTGHEVGLHGTQESSQKAERLQAEAGRLTRACGRTVTGVRQHFLNYRIDQTPFIQSAAGFTYDASLGFPEHIGFRNSYAFPFRLYDFRLDAPVDIWQIPLVIMDASLLQHMGTPVDSVMEKIGRVVREVSAFNGVLSLLWHNCRLDEKEVPGVNALYRALLSSFGEQGFVPVTGDRLINRWTHRD